MITFNASQQFAPGLNSTMPWSYGYSEAGGSAYNLIPFDDNTKTPASPSSGYTLTKRGYVTSGTPAIWKNLSPNKQAGVAAGQLALHPGPRPNGDYTILRFTAPQQGTYTVKGRFFAGDSGAMQGLVVRKGNFDSPLQIIDNTTDSSVLSFAPQNWSAAIRSISSLATTATTTVATHQLMSKSTLTSRLSQQRCST